MINPAKIAFDFDGVVADTITLFLEIARNEYGIDGIDYSDITSYHLEECLDIDSSVIREIGGKIVDGNYHQPLRIIDGAGKALNRLAQSHSPVLFVTARPILGPVGHWVEENITPDPGRVDIIPTGSFDGKAAILQERRITHFVEDRLETCFLLKDAGIEPVLFEQPWNRRPHSFTEVDGWPQLEALIDFSA